jgi:hypothetical protein
MNLRQVLLMLPPSLLLAAGAAAGQGLIPPAFDALWPRWQTRIALQTTNLAPVSLADRASPARGLQGGAVLGDYTFARPSFGNFRATSGVLAGALGGASALAAMALPGQRVSLALQAAGPSLVLTEGPESPSALPYLGLGFSTPASAYGLAVSADVGLVAEHASGLGRAVLGMQGLDAAQRELRLSPVLQLGLRYTF